MLDLRESEANPFAEDVVFALRERHEERTSIRFPSAKFQGDPAAFAYYILGVELWEVQIAVLTALTQHLRTAWASGHRVGKSMVCGIAVLWFYCSFKDARVLLTAPTSRQLDGILWREIKMLIARSGKCVDCRRADPDDQTIPRPCPHSAVITDKPRTSAVGGMKSDDFREIKGVTAKNVEDVTGWAGRNLFFLGDESSGVADAIFEGLEGNRAGSSSTSQHSRVVMLLTSNPTKTTGEFFEAFTKKKRFYHTIQTSSEESPNYISGTDTIPGLATREWVDEKREMWGEDSPLFKVRVLGQFPEGQDGKIFSVDRIAAAETRWEEDEKPTASEGMWTDDVLFINVDSTGETGRADDAGFCARTQLTVHKLYAVSGGLTPEAHVTHVMGMIAQYASPKGKTIVVLDAQGKVGSEVRTAMLEAANETKAFSLVSVYESAGAVRKPRIFGTMRDELASNLDDWMRAGGCFPADDQLDQELQLWEWGDANKGRLKLKPTKDEARKVIKRSPTKYDALALSVWEPLNLADLTGKAGEVMRDARRKSRGERFDRGLEEPAAQGLNPYAGGLYPHKGWPR